MRLFRDEVYALIAGAKGDAPASREEQTNARKVYNEFLDLLTEELQREAPGDLSITRESVRVAIERAYHDYRILQKPA